MLDLAALDVPDFYEHAAKGELDEQTVIAMQGWFMRQKPSPLYYFETGQRSSIYEVLHGMLDVNRDLSYVLSGCTADGHAHSVVARSARIVHDPANETIADPLPRPMPDGGYRVGIIAKYL